jgi:hypothetical protein
MCIKNTSSKLCVKHWNRIIVLKLGLLRTIMARTLLRNESTNQLGNRVVQWRSIEWFIEDHWPGFLAVVWFGSSPPFFHPLPPASCLSLSRSPCVVGHRSSLLTGERGKGLGEEPFKTMARKPGLLYIIQYSGGTDGRRGQVIPLAPSHITVK